MRLKNRLGQIKADCANFTHGRLLCSGVFNTSTLALRCRQGASTPSLSGTSRGSEFNLLGHREGVVDLDAKVPDGALQLLVTEEQLAGSQVASLLVDERHLRPAQAMR